MASRKVHLGEEQIAKLMSLPETGMGYHLVDLYMKDGTRRRDRIVLNSEFLVLNNDETIVSEAIADLSPSASVRESD